ncbi:hypothetical protein D3C78_872370 [compost metagenome]
MKRNMVIISEHELKVALRRAYNHGATECYVVAPEGKEEFTELLSSDQGKSLREEKIIEVLAGLSGD